MAFVPQRKRREYYTLLTIMFLLNNSVHKVYTNLKLNLGQVIFANSTVLLVKEPNTINSLIC